MPQILGEGGQQSRAGRGEELTPRSGRDLYPRVGRPSVIRPRALRTQACPQVRIHTTQCVSVDVEHVDYLANNILRVSHLKYLANQLEILLGWL